MPDQHASSAEAVQIFNDVQAKRAIGILWGSVQSGDEPLDKPSGLLEEATREVARTPGAIAILRDGHTPELSGSDTSDKQRHTESNPLAHR